MEEMTGKHHAMATLQIRQAPRVLIFALLIVLSISRGEKAATFQPQGAHNGATDREAVDERTVTGGGIGGFSWGWGGGGGGGGGGRNGGWGWGWGGGGGGGGYSRWGCGGKWRRFAGKRDHRLGEYGQCMVPGRCMGKRLDCPLHCGGPCLYDCRHMCRALCKTHE